MINKSYYLISPDSKIKAGPFSNDISAARAQVLHPDTEIRDSEEMQAIFDSHNCHDNGEFSESGPYGAGSYCKVCGRNIWYFPL